MSFFFSIFFILRTILMMILKLLYCSSEIKIVIDVWFKVLQISVLLLFTEERENEKLLWYWSSFCVLVWSGLVWMGVPGCRWAVCSQFPLIRSGFVSWSLVMLITAHTHLFGRTNAGCKCLGSLFVCEWPSYVPVDDI